MLGCSSVNATPFSSVTRSVVSYLTTVMVYYPCNIRCLCAHFASSNNCGVKYGYGQARTKHSEEQKFFPITATEVGDALSMDDLVHWGSLPQLLGFSSHDERKAYLETYALTYLKEEIWDEHLVRDLNPFRALYYSGMPSSKSIS